MTSTTRQTQQHNAAYSVAEEIANAVSHGIGALLSVAGLTVLVVWASLDGDVSRITSFSIYGASLVILFLASTLYHAIGHVKTKEVLKTLDHCAIYLLIAGTYTPLMMVTLQGSLGYSMLALIWSLAIAGVWFKVKFGTRYKIISLITYLGMGFISLFIIHHLYQALSLGGTVLLAAGGLVYASGVYFYVQKKIPFNHAIWHVFVLGGASCHFFMMVHYV
ncbi:hemolysin III family protein [Thalassotalea sp. LPB0316]|uniref:PAQR family membrane homeostasis protein TrhA n=1 Tax=Thalassotalea sp. LPB0316 TaxID=2769490 RepID=UPI0018691251|nr:hemolysin III family protein [Thalassotalea sp. LPB0316]QOL26443.1 hemolysin III family protein [Thalassotalea sp. LPB0316]